MFFVLGVRGTLSLETNASLPVNGVQAYKDIQRYSHVCSCLGQPKGLKRSVAI